MFLIIKLVLISLNILGGIIFRLLSRGIRKRTNLIPFSNRVKVAMDGILMIEIIYLFASLNIGLNPDMICECRHIYHLAELIKSSYFLMGTVWVIIEGWQELKIK